MLLDKKENLTVACHTLKRADDWLFERQAQ